MKRLLLASVFVTSLSLPGYTTIVQEFARGLSPKEPRGAASGFAPLQDLFPINGKRQQHIPRQATPDAVTGADEQHSTSDCRSRPIHRAALAGNSINPREFPGGIKIPNHLAVCCRVGPQMAIHSA